MFCDHECVFILRNPRSELSMLLMMFDEKYLIDFMFLLILNLVHYVVDPWKFTPHCF